MRFPISPMPSILSYPILHLNQITKTSRNFTVHYNTVQTTLVPVNQTSYLEEKILSRRCCYDISSINRTHFSNLAKENHVFHCQLNVNFIQLVIIPTSVFESNREKTVFCCMCTAKAQIRLHRCAVWSVSL